MPHGTRVRKILVATDFSTNSSHAVQRAGLLAAAHRAAVHLIHANTSLIDDLLEHDGARDRSANQIDTALQTRLESEASVLRERDIDVTAEVVRKGPLAAIVEALESFPADLVVVGARGRRSLRNTVLGTTAQRLLVQVPQGVLAVRSRPRSPYSNILVCVDTDCDAAGTLVAARTLFPSERLHVVHAYEPLFEGKLLFAGASESTIRQHRKEARTQAKRALVDVIQRSGVEIAAGSRMLRRGDPSQIIVKLTQRRKFDLVVLGRPRATLAAEIFLGTVPRN